MCDKDTLSNPSFGARFRKRRMSEDTKKPNGGRKRKEKSKGEKEREREHNTTP